MLIFGGTTEGRRLARALSAMGHQVWVSVATPLGAEELAGLEVSPKGKVYDLLIPIIALIIFSIFPCSMWAGTSRAA